MNSADYIREHYVCEESEHCDHSIGKHFPCCCSHDQPISGTSHLAQQGSARMAARQIQDILRISRRTVARWRKYPDWPEVETPKSIKAWAMRYDLWDPVAQRRTRGRMPRCIETCVSGQHPWIDENISGDGRCRLCCNASALKRYYRRSSE